MKTIGPMNKSRKTSGAKSGAGEMPPKGPGPAGMRKAGMHPSVSVGTKKGKPC